jgi:hypothetical protein
LSYTPSVANPLLISHEAHTNRQKHQILEYPHFDGRAGHSGVVHSAVPMPPNPSSRRLYNLGKFSSGWFFALHATEGFLGPVAVDCARYRGRRSLFV